MTSDNMKLIMFHLKAFADQLDKEVEFNKHLFEKKPTKELPKWEEEPFDDTKYIPIEFIRMMEKVHANNERYYRNIGETEEANEENISFLCLHNLLHEWENNRPQWAEHIPNVHTPTGEL